MCEVFIRGGPRLTGRTTTLGSSVGSLLRVRKLRRLQLFGHCSVRGVSGRLFSCYIGAIFSRPRLSVTSRRISLRNCAIFNIRCLPKRFSRETTSTTRYVRLVSGNRQPLIGATEVCSLGNGLAGSDVSTVGGCIVGPIRTERTDLSATGALGAGCRVPAAIRALANFATLSSRRLHDFVGRGNLTVSFRSVGFYRDCFLSRGHSPAVARVGVVSAC